MSSGGGSGEWDDSTDWFGGSYTDEQWANVQELAGRLGIEVDRLKVGGNRDRILVALGYSRAWGVDNGMMGLIRAWFTSCGRCGATVAIREAEEGKLAPLDQHTHWHALVEGVLPNGQVTGKPGSI
jgi:hypothetical protein